jgi:hypothetical protein
MPRADSSRYGKERGPWDRYEVANSTWEKGILVVYLFRVDEERRPL